MLVGTAIIQLRASWVTSLKEKRMIVKSLLGRVKNKFNVSIAEIAEQDRHQTIVLGVAFVAASTAQADSITDHVLDFIEENTEAEVVDVNREIR